VSHGAGKRLSTGWRKKRNRFKGGGGRKKEKELLREGHLNGNVDLLGMGENRPNKEKKKKKQPLGGFVGEIVMRRREGNRRGRGGAKTGDQKAEKGRTRINDSVTGKKKKTQNLGGQEKISFGRATGEINTGERAPRPDSVK